MNAEQRVARNSASLVIVIVIERALVFMLSWYIARRLGAVAMGEYSLALVWLFMMLPLAIWGFDMLLMREIARQRTLARHYLLRAGLVTFGSITLSVLVMGLLVPWFNYPPAVNQLLWLCALWVLPFYTWSILLETTIKAHEHMELIATIRVPLAAVRVGLSILLLAWGAPLAGVFLLLGGFYALSCLAYGVLIYRYNPAFTHSTDTLQIRQLVSASVPFVLIGVLGITFKQVDRIVLSAFSTVEEVGVYTVGATVMAMVLLLAPAVMESVFPGLARMYHSAPQELPATITRLMRMLWFLTVPITLATVALIKPAILLLFSAEYVDAISVAQILALATVPAFLNRLLYRVLLASNNETASIRVAGFNSLIGIGLNFLLIPRFGLVGASIAAVGGEVAGFAQNLHFAHTRVMNISLWRAIGQPLLCALCAGLAYGMVAQWNSYAALVVSLLVFGVAASSVRLISRTDFAALSAR